MGWNNSLITFYYVRLVWQSPTPFACRHLRVEERHGRRMSNGGFTLKGLVTKLSLWVYHKKLSFWMDGNDPTCDQRALRRSKINPTLKYTSTVIILRTRFWVSACKLWSAGSTVSFCGGRKIPFFFIPPPSFFRRYSQNQTIKRFVLMEIVN